LYKIVSCSAEHHLYLWVLNMCLNLINHSCFKQDSK